VNLKILTYALEHAGARVFGLFQPGKHLFT